MVGQGNLRREVLREHDVSGGANIGLIDLVARYAHHSRRPPAASVVPGQRLDGGHQKVGL